MITRVMSGRPTFWMHRTRRFWFGLIAILLLSAFTLSLAFYRHQVTYIPITLGPNPSPALRLALEDGSLVMERRRVLIRSSPPTTSEWRFETTRHYGFALAPSFSTNDSSSRRSSRNFLLVLPFWPLILVLFVLWPIWMHRGDKMEEEAFATPNIRTPDA